MIASALAGYDYRAATEAVWRIAVEANRYIEHTRPWELAKAERNGAARRDDALDQARDSLDAVLSALLHACQAIGDLLAPFLPDLAAQITRQCVVGPDGPLPAATPVQPRLDPPALDPPALDPPALFGAAG